MVLIIFIIFNFILYLVNSILPLSVKMENAEVVSFCLLPFLGPGSLGRPIADNNYCPSPPLVLCLEVVESSLVAVQNGARLRLVAVQVHDFNWLGTSIINGI